MNQDCPVRPVELVGGMWDGLTVYVSHNMAICTGELYVHDGGPNRDRLVYAPTIFASMDPEVRKTELAIMTEWVKTPSLLPRPDMPDWRLMAWVEALRYGIKV